MTKKAKVILLIIILVVVGFLSYYFLTQNRSQPLCWPYCPGMTDEDRSKIKEDMRQAGCPDEMIVDKMPSVIDDSGVIPPPKAYYIKDGQRVEVADYDSVWVSANCEVPVLEVQ
jgi:hypothetical protein